MIQWMKLLGMKWVFPSVSQQKNDKNAAEPNVGFQN